MVVDEPDGLCWREADVRRMRLGRSPKTPKWVLFRVLGKVISYLHPGFGMLSVLGFLIFFSRVAFWCLKVLVLKRGSRQRESKVDSLCLDPLLSMRAVSSMQALVNIPATWPTTIVIIT